MIQRRMLFFSFFNYFCSMNSNLSHSLIKSWIAQGEHGQQDFKFEISDSRKIAKSISAFANTEGGRLLIGVKDNGRVAGVSSDEERFMIEAAVQLYCSPQPQITMQTVSVDGRSVLVVEIEENEHKPVLAKDENGKLWAYIRIHDENILATPVHLCLWKQNDKANGEIITFTKKEQLLLDMLKEEPLLSLNRYCRKSKTSRRDAQYLLAKLIRYDIVEPIFENHLFYYRLK